MKYWNKDKEIRRRHWHQVGIPNSHWGYQQTKRHLQLIDSPGKFYMYFGSRTVWFERKEDATWFLLTQA